MSKTKDEAMDIFFPEGYEIPDASTGYMKFKQGENKFRVLGSMIMGWETWIEEEGNKKPLRKPMEEPFSTNEVDDPTQIKHFWAFPVWNYQEDRVQILEITQKGIMKSLKALVKDNDWGDPKKYDIVITREGERLETEYQVNPKPKTKLDEGINRFYKDLEINLDALYKGDDPFASPMSEEDIDKVASVI